MGGDGGLLTNNCVKLALSFTPQSPRHPTNIDIEPYKKIRLIAHMINNRTGCLVV